MDDDLQQWFIREILVHERALLRFMTRVWPDRAEVDDLCHETYIRVYESAAKARPLAPRGFLFATARHLMADRVRRGRIVSIEMKEDLDALNVLIDDLSPEHRLSSRQDLWRLAQAFALLPPKCRDVIWMIKVQELPHKEVALRLSITPKAVERRIARGLRLLEQAYFVGDDYDQRPAAGRNTKGESDHG
jgi:RNA polymerase sigma factor (sigma-70 family)